MSTLLLRAAYHRPLPNFARVGAIIAIVLDAFAEAQRQTHEVAARYPFME